MHGITITEINEGAPALSPLSTAIIGIVATGPNADATIFPENRPVRVLDLSAAMDKAGAGGTLRAALRAISTQTRAPVVVVRVVPASGTAAAQNTAVIGGETNGVKTGMQALLAAEAQLGLKPRILGCPGLDTQPVTAALVAIAQKLRGMAYAAALGADSVEAITYAGGFGQRELMLLYPNFQAAGDNGAIETVNAVAYALGLRARIDQEQGWHKVLSNVPVDGVVGLSKDVGFDIQDATCEANLLNAAKVTALIRSEGFRFWGSRTLSADPLFAFESATRTAQVLLDTIGKGLTWAIDKPLKPSLVKDIVEVINQDFRVMRREGRILGGRAWFDLEKNTSATLAGGRVTIDYDYMPVPPLENLILRQHITDSFTQDFSAVAG